jgi:hypothetical protein
MPLPLSDVGAASEDGQVVIAGGRDAAGRVHDEILGARAAP